VITLRLNVTRYSITGQVKSNPYCSAYIWRFLSTTTGAIFVVGWGDVVDNLPWMTVNSAHGQLVTCDDLFYTACGELTTRM